MARNLATARALHTFYHPFLAVNIFLFAFLFVFWIPKFDPAQVIPFYLAAWVVHVILTLSLLYRSRWTAGLLSNFASACLVLMASLFVLGAFARPLADETEASDEFENDELSPFFLAFVILSLACGPNTAGSGFPATAWNGWMLLIVPATYLVASLSWYQGHLKSTFVKVVLLNFYLILEVVVYAWWSVMTRDRSARSHFFTVRDLGTEQEVCDRFLSLLLPPPIHLASTRGAASAVPDSGTGAPGQAAIVDGNVGESIAGTGLKKGVVSLSDERFAERFPDASVLFAQGARTSGGLSKVNSCSRMPL